MKKIIMVVSILALVIVGVVGTGAVALAKDPPGQGNDFVCPVIKSAAVGEHNPIAGPLGIAGYWTVVPATAKANHLNLPDKATNMNGAGSPEGPFAAPGDTDYSAVWNGPHP